LEVLPTPPVRDPKILVDVTTFLDTLEDLLGVGRFTVSAALYGRRSPDVGATPETLGTPGSMRL